MLDLCYSENDLDKLLTKKLEGKIFESLTAIQDIEQLNYIVKCNTDVINANDKQITNLSNDLEIAQKSFADMSERFMEIKNLNSEQNLKMD